jgi:hypothetical protein
MSIFLERGKEDPRPFVPRNFELPGFARQDIIDSGWQYCVFSANTGQRIRPGEIHNQALLTRAVGEPGIEIEAGVEAGGDWWVRRRLVKDYKRSTVNPSMLQEMQGEIGELRRAGCFGRWASGMREEYEIGRSFIDDELLPAVSGRFPRYSAPIDRFDRHKFIMFITKDYPLRGMIWRIGPCEFAVSIPEISKVLPDEEIDIHAFKTGGKLFQAHDFHAVWYPTRDRDTTFSEGDTNRRTKLLHECLNTIVSYF